MTLSVLLPLLTTFVGAFSGWVFSRRRQKADAQKAELDNVEKAVGIWRKMSEDLAAKVSELSQRCEQLTSEIEGLRRENKSLKLELKRLEKTIKTNIDQSVENQ